MKKILTIITVLLMLTVFAAKNTALGGIEPSPFRGVILGLTGGVDRNGSGIMYAYGKVVSFKAAVGKVTTDEINIGDIIGFDLMSITAEDDWEVTDLILVTKGTHITGRGTVATYGLGGDVSLTLPGGSKGITAPGGSMGITAPGGSMGITLPGGSKGLTIFDGVVVIADGAIINGDILVSDGAILIVDRSLIKGDIIIQTGGSVFVNNSAVTGKNGVVKFFNEQKGFGLVAAIAGFGMLSLQDSKINGLIETEMVSLSLIGNSEIGGSIVIDITGAGVITEAVLPVLDFNVGEGPKIEILSMDLSGTKVGNDIVIDVTGAGIKTETKLFKIRAEILSMQLSSCRVAGNISIDLPLGFAEGTIPIELVSLQLRSCTVGGNIAIDVPMGLSNRTIPVEIVSMHLRSVTVGGNISIDIPIGLRGVAKGGSNIQTEIVSMELTGSTIGKGIIIDITGAGIGSFTLTDNHIGGGFSATGANSVSIVNSRICGKTTLNDNGTVSLAHNSSGYQGLSATGNGSLELNCIEMIGNTDIIRNDKVNINYLTLNGNLLTERNRELMLSNSMISGDNVSLNNNTVAYHCNHVGGNCVSKNNGDISMFYMNVCGDMTSNNNNNLVVTNGMYYQSVSVKNSQDVSITGTTIVGGDLMINNSKMVALTGIHSYNNILSQNNKDLSILDSRICGSIIIENSKMISLSGNEVDGDLEIFGHATSCTTSGNTVDGFDSGCPCSTQGRASGIVKQITGKETAVVEVASGQKVVVKDPNLRKRNIKVGEEVCFDVVLIKGKPVGHDIKPINPKRPIQVKK